MNGAVAKPSLHLAAGDEVEFNLKTPGALEGAAPENLPLQIVYEDASLAVVEKPAGMTVHVGAGVRSGTLVNALMYHLNSLSRGGDATRPGIVHRLDKNTSGLLVVAKTDAAQTALAEQFRRRSIGKKYLALVHGRLRRAAGDVTLPVARDRVHRTRMTTKRREGREALTHYRVVRELENFSLLEVEIKTGRTHQIRVHMSAIGHPVVGDTTYGAPHRIRLAGNTTPVPTLNRHFLHAAHLSFKHPVTGDRMAFNSPLPEALQQFLEMCEKKQQSATVIDSLKMGRL